MIPVFELFQQMIIHRKVYDELDDEARSFIDTYRGKNTIIVSEGRLYGTDPQYPIRDIAKML